MLVNKEKMSNDAVSSYEVVDVHMYLHNNQVPHYFHYRMVVMENHMNMNYKYFLKEQNIFNKIIGNIIPHTDYLKCHESLSHMDYG
jgi:hypothetical protein